MSTTVRPATVGDVDAIVEMAERFYPESPYAGMAPLRREAVAGLALITIDTGVMLVAESDGALVGMICLHVDHFVFNVEMKIAHELVFWVAPEARGGSLAMRLIKEAEAAARARGASFVRMATLAGSPPQAAGMYERLGYRITETYFTKDA